MRSYMCVQAWKQVSLFRKLHQSEIIKDFEQDVQRGCWRVAAVTFEKKMVVEIKKTSGIAKISAIRIALKDLASAKVPDHFVNETFLKYAQKLVKK